VLGAFILFPLSQYLVFWLPSTIAGQVHLALLGVVLVLVARFMPDGLIVTIGNWWAARTWRARSDRVAPASAGGSP
jgi:ABC-type branched-subunit amino acid transport system permease subunit